MATQFSPRPGTSIIALEGARPSSSCGAAPGGDAPVSRVPDAPLGIGQAALMVTRRCNMACAHCSVESGPRVEGEPDDAELRRIVGDLAALGVRGLLITGGEPMLREKIVLELLAQCRELGLMASMTSNGFWGKTPERAEATLQRLCEAGLSQLNISYDRYHAQFQGPQPAVNIALAAQKRGLTLNIGITRTAEDLDLDAIVAPFDAIPSARLRFYDVQPIGRARDLPKHTLRAEVKGFCNACDAPAITDDGRVTACNGPSYFSAPESPLSVGFLRDEPMSELLQRHRSDPILETIRTFGPARLLAELRQMPGYENFGERDFAGMCDLCLFLTSNPGAMELLGAHLSQPKFEAERLAFRRVIAGARRGGELSRDYINSLGANRVWLQAATRPENEWSGEAERVLGRADFDWHFQLFHLGQCGLVGPLQRALGCEALSRWAPRFFLETMRRQAMSDAMRALLQREAMRRISGALGEMGGRGVLLKGSAMLALDGELASQASPPLATRASGDVDIYVAPKWAPKLRNRLLELGFCAPNSPRNTGDNAHLHQLEALVFEGVLVEIHQTLLPAYCGVPERAMLEAARPLQDPQFAHLATLSGEGMLLHSALHGIKHLFAHYLKTAWDSEWIIDRFPALDWNLLAKWGHSSGMNRGFWVALCLLSREMPSSVPTSLLEQAPRDAKQRRLEAFARRHLLGAARFQLDENPWLRRGVQLALCDSNWHRAKILSGFVFGRSSNEFRKRKGLKNPEYKHLNLRKVWKAWRAWRRS